MIFDKSNYNIRLELNIQNTSSSPLSFQIPLILGVLDLASKQSKLNYHDISISDGEKTIYPNIKKDGIFSKLKFMGMRDRYFCAIIRTEDKNLLFFYVKKYPLQNRNRPSIPELIVKPRSGIKTVFSYVFGATRLRLIKAKNLDWQSVIYLEVWYNSSSLT